MDKKISVIIPTYNEEGNVKPLYEQIVKVLSETPYNRELLFIDNCSNDNTLKKLEKIYRKDRSVTVIVLSRNFGSSQPSYLAGLRESRGQCAVLMDGDLQDPPKVIKKFIKRWEEGYDVVYGVRVKRKGSFLRRIGYRIFYRIFKFLAYIPVPLDAGDFSLVDRKVINEMIKISERDYYLRGIRSYVGFKQIGVPYIRNDRYRGTSHLPFFGNFYWAKHAIINFSNKPLQVILPLVLTMAFFSAVSIIVYLFSYFDGGKKPSSTAIIIIIMFFLSSLQLLSIGIIAEYLMKVFIEVKGRPSYIIEKIYKHASKPSK